MTDFHSHLLPGIDDGSDGIDISLDMLRMWSDQGIDRVAATPHFYADVMNPRRFLSARQQAFDSLAEAMDKCGLHTDLILGAEVRYFRGMSGADVLDDLCLEGTKLLLLEMPFSSLWSESMLREITAILQRGIIPVAAHVERYIFSQPKRLVQDFFALDILIQSNAEFFLTRRTAKTALRMLRDGQIHFIGSDAHNTTTRPPNFGTALKLIEEKLGHDAVQRLSEYDRMTYPEDSKT